MSAFVVAFQDRVLFRCRKKNDVVCLHYDAVLTIRSSDHRPVYAVFEVGLRPGKDNRCVELISLVGTIYLLHTQIDESMNKEIYPILIGYVSKISGDMVFGCS